VHGVSQSSLYSLICQALAQVLASLRTASTFLQTIFASGYPRLLRLFQEFFEHVSTVSGAIYSMTKQT
jgi:hypothetical protein